MIDGLLVIDKPSGPTSHDVVAAARRILKERRIGHTGTLDPMATGVLPLVIGRATRLASLLSASDKEYVAGIRLGTSTATYDASERLASGEPPPSAPNVSREEVDRALNGFRGELQQVPPPYSAKKIGGRRAYTLARADRPVLLHPVSVTVHELEALGLADGLLTVRVLASAGFYVRSLAHDLGQALGCGAHLESLRRTRAAGFGPADAVDPNTLELDPAAAAQRVLPMSRLLGHLPAVTLSEAGRTRASHGSPLSPRDFTTASEAPGGEPGSRVRLLGPDGALVGIAVQGADGVLRPSVVLV